MWKDPIVKEIRELRALYAASCGNGPDAIYTDIIKRQADRHNAYVTRPPKPANARRKIA